MLEAIQTFMQSNVLLHLRLVDVLDIAILSYAIYKILWMLRKTSSGRVLWGIVILIFAMFLSSASKMIAIPFLLNKVLEWFILMLVILFQPELRRFLERVGSSRFGLVFAPAKKESTQEVDSAIAQITEAYIDMSRDKVGALMVFERQNLLDDIIKTGTALDCAISSELLKNIFWNKAPLHDGAVIVRDGRIVGAGCMLPLSGNVNLSRDLGMRHRAGIGISERTDAVVAIVSEETGSISVAMDGMLKRHLAPETLGRLLKNELLSETAEDKKSNTHPWYEQILFRGRKEDNQK